jgi:signal transduction histidine kinase
MMSENSEIPISLKIKEEIRYFNLKISIIYDKDQTKLGKMVIFSDTTQVTVYQEKLLSNAKQLTELSAFKDKLFTVVAHDIRDPLALLVSLTELLEEELKNVGNENLHIFQEVSGQVKNTYMLVENLLDWFRSQTGKIIFSPLVWGLDSIIQQAVNTLKIRADMKGIQISSHVDDQMLVFADKEMMDLVLRNLLSNAIKFTEVGGRIDIQAERDDGQIIISVRDTGVGVDEEIAETLFDEFQQKSCSGTEGEKGTGLGLYLSAKFVHINSGDIRFESVTGQGSTFIFTLPAKESASGVYTRIGQEFEVI